MLDAIAWDFEVIVEGADVWKRRKSHCRGRIHSDIDWLKQVQAKPRDRTCYYKLRRKVSDSGVHTAHRRCGIVCG